MSRIIEEPALQDILRQLMLMPYNQVFRIIPVLAALPQQEEKEDKV